MQEKPQDYIQPLNFTGESERTKKNQARRFRPPLQKKHDGRADFARAFSDATGKLRQKACAGKMVLPRKSLRTCGDCGQLSCREDCGQNPGGATGGPPIQRLIRIAWGRRRPHTTKRGLARNPLEQFRRGRRTKQSALLKIPSRPEQWKNQRHARPSGGVETIEHIYAHEGAGHDLNHTAQVSSGIVRRDEKNTGGEPSTKSLSREFFNGMKEAAGG